jgi:iron complex transport system ATP-binding protein
VTAVLETQALSVAIGDTTVCRELDLQLRQGERWCILGRNGTGKTTLLHTLAGLRPAAAGRIRLSGRLLDQLPGRTLARRLGILFQDHQDSFPATVLETALTGRHPWLGLMQWEGPTDLALARAALRRVALDGLEARNVTTLSGGERRRLGIATLLTQDPELMLLDEPTNHLDIHYRIRVLDLLRELSSGHGKTLLLVMHDVNLALRYCNRFLLLFGNGAHCSGTAAVIDRANLERLYDHPLQCLQGAGSPVWIPR